MIISRINSYDNIVRQSSKTSSPSFKLNPQQIFNQTSPKDLLIERLIYNYMRVLKSSNYSLNPMLRELEQKLAKEGINTRFRDDMKLAEYTNGAIECLKQRKIEIPHNIIFTSPFLIKSGISIWARTFPQKEAPIILSKKIYENENNKTTLSSTHPYHTFFHETGHWLHFNNNFNLIKNYNIWKEHADTERISKVVSQRAIALEDGSEFCAEVFAGIMSGKDFPDDILRLLKELNFPNIL